MAFMAQRRELQEYGDTAYWDERYTNDAGPFDWYQRYSGLQTLLDKYVAKSSKVLMIGCGNALTSEEMVKDGYEDIVNIDISPVVVESMQQKYAEQSQLQYQVMDAREMQEFKDGTFDAVIDKGLLDSLLCGTTAQQSAAQMLGEVCRVLRQGGVYLLVTHGEPKQRLSHLRQPEVLKWSIALHVVPKPGCQSKQADPGNTWDCTEAVPLPEEEQPAEADGKEAKGKAAEGKKENGKKDKEGGKKAEPEAKKDGKAAPAEGKKDGGKKDAKGEEKLPDSPPPEPTAQPEPRTYLQYYGEADVHFVYICAKEGGSSKGKDSKAAGKDAKGKDKAAPGKKAK